MRFLKSDDKTLRDYCSIGGGLLGRRDGNTLKIICRCGNCERYSDAFPAMLRTQQRYNFRCKTCGKISTYIVGHMCDVLMSGGRK